MKNKSVDDVIEKIKYELNHTEVGLGIKQLTLCNNLIRQEIISYRNGILDELEQIVRESVPFVCQNKLLKKIAELNVK